MPEESLLTHQTLVDLLQWLDPRTIFFIEERFCLKVDEDGKDIFFKVPMLGEQVWLMHPDHVPRFLLAARRAGLIPVKFDFERHNCRVRLKWKG